MGRVTRRTFLSRAGTASVAAIAAGPAILRARPQAPAVRVDAAALRARIEALSVFGRPAGGTFADGVSRVAFSDADVDGRRYVIDLMRAAKLEPRVDPAGNIFARRAGADASLPPILFGSHIDSVPNGGNFDGDLGSLAALGAIEALDRANLRTRHPLEIVVWSSEEGVAFGRGLAGSRIVAGDVKPADMDAVWNGLRRGDAVRKIGGNPDRIMDAVRPKGAHHAYFELHIEQGGTLEKSSTSRRCRRRHRRDRALRGRRHRLREPRRDDADAGAAGCADCGVAVDDRGARGRDEASQGGRSAPSARSTSRRTRRTSFPAWCG